MIPEHHTSRRTLMRFLLGVPFLASTPLALTACNTREKAERLDIASGEDGGMYHQFAALLADELVANGVAEQSAALTTQASAQNLTMLAEGKVQLSLALADTAAQYRQENHPGPQPVALGRVYQNYFHCIVRADSGISSLNDLAGRNVGTGAPGSGTWVTGQRILDAAGLKNHENPPQELKYGYLAGLEALKEQRIDALFLFGGMPVAPLSQLASSQDLNLINVAGMLPRLREEYPGLYDQVVIPAGTYRGIQPVVTVGVGNLLMVSEAMHEATAASIVKLLVDRAEKLVPSSSAGIQYLSPQTLISTAGQPLHPGAIEAYRQLHG